MAALTVALLFESLRRHAGPVAAWLGAAALALAQPWLVYSAVLEPDLLIGAAVAATIVLLSAEDRGPRRLALAGLALGLAISLRPTALLFGACAVAFLVARKTSWRALSTFGVVTAVAALGPPLALRARAGQDLRTTMSAGQVFHQSHRPESLGFGATFPSLLKVVEGQLATGPHAPDSAHELYRELARVSEPGRVDASAAEVYWLQRACAGLPSSHSPRRASSA